MLIFAMSTIPTMTGSTFSGKAKFFIPEIGAPMLDPVLSSHFREKAEKYY